MKLITIDNEYYMLADESPQLFETVCCPDVRDGIWDEKTYKITMLNSNLMALLPNEFDKVRKIVASTKKVDYVILLKREQIEPMIGDMTECDVDVETETACKSGCLNMVLNGERSVCCGDTIKRPKITDGHINITSVRWKAITL